jgi:GAF domain-containing protein
MPYSLAGRLQPGPHVRWFLEQLLAASLAMTGASLGNVQLIDWKTGDLSIAVQRGFDHDFLGVFRVVGARDGSACGRAVRARSPIVIEDVMRDVEFAPYRGIALASGFRAVQSTPLISGSGAFLGVVSTHFPAAHRPTDREMQALRRAGGVTANAVIRQRALARAAGEQILSSSEAVARSHDLLRRVEELLRL